MFKVIQYCLQMYLKILEKYNRKNILKYILEPAHFFSAPGLAWQACLKKTGVKVKLLTNSAIIMMLEKRIWIGMSYNS